MTTLSRHLKSMSNVQHNTHHWIDTFGDNQRLHARLGQWNRDVTREWAISCVPCGTVEEHFRDIWLLDSRGCKFKIEIIIEIKLKFIAVKFDNLELELIIYETSRFWWILFT